MARGKGGCVGDRKWRALLAMRGSVPPPARKTRLADQAGVLNDHTRYSDGEQTAAGSRASLKHQIFLPCPKKRSTLPPGAPVLLPGKPTCIFVTNMSLRGPDCPQLALAGALKPEPSSALPATAVSFSARARTLRRVGDVSRATARREAAAGARDAALGAWTRAAGVHRDALMAGDGRTSRK